MERIYFKEVHNRFLNSKERLFLTDETELPLVIEPKDDNSLSFLLLFLNERNDEITQLITRYGAVLLRGFKIDSEHDFESVISSIPLFKPMADAFMSEEGRLHAAGLNYVLQTNAIYKTGGTLYLGGFHSENYYSPDVPAYISFFCLQPSLFGGETGLINMQKIYGHFNPKLKEKLGAKPFLAKKWLISEIMERYHLDYDSTISFCKKNKLPILGEGTQALVMMYKPSVLEHPLNSEETCQINLFEIPGLNHEIRQVFCPYYQGKQWTWHRFVWRLPQFCFTLLEAISVASIFFFYSPKQALESLKKKIKRFFALRKYQKTYSSITVGSCFNKAEVKHFARLTKQFYSSCLWRKGDVLLIDNRQVMHAGMPGAGPRTIRAIISNPLDIPLTDNHSGRVKGIEKTKPTLFDSLKDFEK